MVVSLIKFTQGITTDIPGRAVVGATGAAVTVTNGDNTNVASWKFEVLEVPPGSAVPLATQGPSPVNSFNMGTPDRAGCYRVRLTVADSAGNQDIDIRNFGVPLPNLAIIPPSFQGLPLPLPLTGTGAKPDELNFGGQARGWMGDNTTTRRLMHQVLEIIDTTRGEFVLPVSLVAGGGGAPDDVTVFNANAPFAFTLIDAWLQTATAVGGSTVQARTATGGGGSALTTALSSAATATTRNDDTAPRAVAAGGSVFLRRSDNAVAGTFYIRGLRT